jgi:PEP-CTERM motif
MNLKVRSNVSSLAASAAVWLCAAASAQAAPILVAGNTNGSLATASGELSLVGNTLTLTLTNTSPFDARITGLGFDLVDGDYTANNSTGLNGFAGSSVGFFTFADTSFGNVAQFDDAVLDFGWRTGSNFTGGTPNKGIAPAGVRTFIATGVFPPLSDEQLASSLFVRFQSVGEDGRLSDIGRGELEQVPEPASIALLGAGLLAFARHLRRSKTG